MHNFYTHVKTPLYYTSILFISFFYVDICFNAITFHSFFSISLLRIALFDLSIALFISLPLSLLKEKHARTVLLILVCISSIYAITQLEFKNFMGNYMSVKAAGDGAGRIKDYILSFILYIKPIYFVCLLAPVFVWSLNHFSSIHLDRIKNSYLICALLSFCLTLYGVSLQSVVQTSSGTVNLASLYASPTFIEKALKEFGVNRFLLRDILSVNAATEITLVDEEIEEITPSISNPRVIDDTQWQEAAEEETNAKIQTIDQYLMNQPVTSFNDKTGQFKDMNFIYIMVEAFDYIAVDEILTPTLYKLKTDGYYFSHHYTPKYSCTTGESEFIGVTSLVPESDVCTPNQYRSNTYSESIFSLFKSAGYSTSAYHNWKDEFYDRNIYFPNMNCDEYYNWDDMGYPTIQGWQSDQELMEFALKNLETKDKFMALIVTSSTHFPYDESSTLGDANLPKVEEVYPDYPIEIQRYLSKAIELDHAIQYLLEELDNQGKLENTVISIFGDHHPLKTDMQMIADATKDVDRTVGLNEDLNPYFIYNVNIKPTIYDGVMSTFDQLPTLANLFGLTYDPRYYIGTDYFSTEKEPVVIFTNGDWISNSGIYTASEDHFEPFLTSSIDDSYITRINRRVSNSFSISSLIFRTNYFYYRNFQPVYTTEPSK